MKDITSFKKIGTSSAKFSLFKKIGTSSAKFSSTSN